MTGGTRGAVMADVQIRDGQRLIDSPGVRQYLRERIRRESALGALSAVTHRTSGTMGLVYAGTWGPDRVPVVVKLNADEPEREWMPAVSACTTDLVPRVHGQGESLDGEDVAWLVLADAPYRFDSARADDCRKLMGAAARFQQVAAGIDGMTYGIDRGFFGLYLPMAIEADCPGPAVTVADRMPADLA